MAAGCEGQDGGLVVGLYDGLAGEQARVIGEKASEIVRRSGESVYYGVGFVDGDFEGRGYCPLDVGGLDGGYGGVSVKVQYFRDGAALVRVVSAQVVRKFLCPADGPVAQVDLHAGFQCRCCRCLAGSSATDYHGSVFFRLRELLLQYLQDGFEISVVSTYT